MPRDGSTRPPPGCLHRWQASSHRSLPQITPVACRSELASRWHYPATTRFASIAGKPAPTGHPHRSPRSPVGASLPRDGITRPPPGLPPSLASQLPQVTPTDHPGRLQERACLAMAAPRPPPGCLHRWQASSHSTPASIPVASIAGKPAPTGHSHRSPRSPVGASLPRDGVSPISLTGAANTCP